MKITGGQACGLRIDAPRGEKTRPTTDRVRESLFATLGERLRGARVLDLFAGTGSLGLEAASRGAAEVVWVESQVDVAQVIRGNFQRLAPAGVQTKGQVMVREVKRYLSGTPLRAFDVIFADPPYAQLQGPLKQTDWISALTSGWLVPGGLMVLEGGEAIPPPVPVSWRLLREKRYGDTRVWIWEAFAASD